MFSLGKLSLHAWHRFAVTHKDGSSGFWDVLRKHTEHISTKGREFQYEN